MRILAKFLVPRASIPIARRCVRRRSVARDADFSKRKIKIVVNDNNVSAGNFFCLGKRRDRESAFVHERSRLHDENGRIINFCRPNLGIDFGVYFYRRCFFDERINSNNPKQCLVLAYLSPGFPSRRLETSLDIRH